MEFQPKGNQPMTISRKKWKQLARHIKPVGNTKPIDHAINYRANLVTALDAATENGRVAICRSGMDCDSVQYSSEDVIDRPRNIIAFLKAEGEHERWLDGPESTWFDKPSNVDDGHYASRDRALEAFEDGHPYSVRMGAL
jgi:hypothetical protein